MSMLDPLEIEDLATRCPALDDTKNTCEASWRKGTCLKFEQFLNSNPSLLKIHLNVGYKGSPQKRVFFLTVRFEFRSAGAKKANSTFEEKEQSDALFKEVGAICAGLEWEVAGVFTGAEKMEVQRAAREVGKALIGQDYEAWMSRRVAAALNKELPACAASVAALRM